jgi:hypothetical protein
VGGCNPLVDAGITWCKTALGNTGNTVLVVGVELTNTVPVDGGRVVGQGVVNCDLDSVTPVANNGGSWNLAVDSKSRSCGSLVVPLDAGDGEVIFTNGASIWVGRVLIGVDVEPIAPRASVTWLVAAVIRDGSPGICGWVGGASGDDGPSLGYLRDGRRILAGSDGAEEAAV